MTSPIHRAPLILACAALSAAPLHAPAAARSANERRAPTLEDIVDAKSIDGLLISPDGQRIAYRVVSPSFAKNQTHVQWYATDLGGTDAPVRFGAEQEPVWLPLFDTVDLPQAAWAADSQSLYALQLSDDQVQVHRLSADGGDAPVTHDPADIVRFSLGGDGVLTYQTRESRAAIDSAQAMEEQRGVRLDRSIDTDGLRLTRNTRIGSRTTSMRRLNGSMGVEAYAGPLRTKTLALPGRPPGRVTQLRAVQPNWSGAMLKSGLNTLWTSAHGSVRVRVAPARTGEDAYVSYAVDAVGTDGAVVPCRAAFCTGLVAELRNLTVNPGTGEVVIFHERDFSARTSIHGWDPVRDRSRTIRAADGSLDAGASYGDNPCPVAWPYAICTQAGPAEPARLVRIDLRNGETSTLANPNALLAGMAFARSRFLRWKDDAGRVSTGILMLPAGPQRGLPLVITTYRCRGFLRGGSGWMVAEHLLVERGFVSLCVNNNNRAITDRDAEGQRLPLGPHRAAIAGYAAIIDQLAEQGLVDRTKVGIAGHSFSSMVTAYAISQTDLFAAAVSVGNTIDASHYYITSPTRDSFRKYVKPTMGLPFPDADPAGILDKVSPARNAARITAPLLMQTVEAEYLSGLELYTRIQDTGGTVDMYIYPGEAHLGGREPAHIYWRNRRSADWFSFWLRGEEYAQPAASNQYEIWHTLRAERDDVRGTVRRGEVDSHITTERR